MTRLTLGITFGIATLSAVVFAQNTTGVSFKSKSGDLEITNIDEPLFEGDAKTNSIDFELTGKPLRGRSDSQKLTFNANKASGKIRQGANGTMFLLSTTLTGAVTIRQNPGASEEVSLTGTSLTLTEAPNRASASISFPGQFTVASKGPDTTITAASGVATLSGSANQVRSLDQVTLRGAVNARSTGNGTTTLSTTGLILNQRSNSSVFQLGSSFTFTNTSDQNTVRLSGSGGSITTPNITTASKGRPISSANLRGRININFSGRDGDGEPITLSAQGDRLTMDSEGEILLIGNVKMEGGGLNYQSDGESQTIYIIVDQNMKPLKYGARGNPAKVNIKPDGGSR